jgi:hypothetical protein
MRSWWKFIYGKPEEEEEDVTDIWLQREFGRNKNLFWVSSYCGLDPRGLGQGPGLVFCKYGKETFFHKVSKNNEPVDWLTDWLSVSQAKLSTKFHNLCNFISVIKISLAKHTWNRWGKQ